MTTSVTVIVTFYNNVDYVEQALEQVRALRGSIYELLLTDDGSTDGTREALVACSASLPNVRILASETNMGIAAIRNWAVREAAGEFVWFLDCDDRWSPQALERLTHLVVENSADIGLVHAKRVPHSAQTDGKLLDSAPSGTYAGESLIRQVLVGGVRGYLWNKLIRRQLLVDNPFPPRSAQEDFAVIAELAFGSATLACSDETMYWHVERLGSITNSRIDSFTDLEQTYRRVVHQVDQSTYQDLLAAELAYFSQWHFRSSVVNTSVRLGVKDNDVQRYVNEVRRSITWLDVRLTWRFSTREGIIAALMKTTGPLYSSIYKVYLKTMA